MNLKSEALSSAADFLNMHWLRSIFDYSLDYFCIVHLDMLASSPVLSP